MVMLQKTLRDNSKKKKIARFFSRTVSVALLTSDYQLQTPCLESSFTVKQPISFSEVLNIKKYLPDNAKKGGAIL